MLCFPFEYDSVVVTTMMGKTWYIQLKERDKEFVLTPARTSVERATSRSLVVVVALVAVSADSRAGFVCMANCLRCAAGLVSRTESVLLDGHCDPAMTCGRRANTHTT